MKKYLVFRLKTKYLFKYSLHPSKLCLGWRGNNGPMNIGVIDPQAMLRSISPPDFTHLLAVLSRAKPERPTLFEFFMNIPLYKKLVGDDEEPSGELFDNELRIRAFRNAGYDYATVGIPGFVYVSGEARKASTRSLNEGAVIRDRASFDAYDWPDTEGADYAFLDRITEILPDGMGLIVHGPGGVLENVIDLVGFENLCYTTIDDTDFTDRLFAAVGTRLVRYYEKSVQHEAVGAVIVNDDWGFKSQTMLSPDQMRRFIFPWHEQIVSVVHGAGKPAILHSCGCRRDVMEDIIEGMKYDGLHSFEDAILPVEESYDLYHDRIAILGGIDVDFMSRATPDEVYERSKRMLKKSECDGGYALGTGNSVPEYVPDENFFAMIRAVLEMRDK